FSEDWTMRLQVGGFRSVGLRAYTIQQYTSYKDARVVLPVDSSVTVTGISFLLRTRVTVNVDFADLNPRSARVISVVLLTRESSTFVITSPALIPAFSAAEPLRTERTRTPSATPKNSARCSASASGSPSITRARLGVSIPNRGNSGIRGNGLVPPKAQARASSGRTVTAPDLRSPMVTAMVWSALFRQIPSFTWCPGGVSLTRR